MLFYNINNVPTNINYPDIYFTPEYGKACEYSDNAIWELCQYKDLIYEHLIDGTMINLFYANDEWIISTRSEIGGYNKWNNKKSFRQMFDECSQLDYETLDKTMSYSFVMRHTENRNISPIHQNELFLVEVYEYKDNIIRRLSKSEYPLAIAE